MIIAGRQVVVGPGATILDAARRAGIPIPTLCHHPALPPDGSCRMCLVEIDGQHGLHPACAVPAVDDLVVHTETEASRSARRNTLRLLLARYRPGAGCPGNELLALADRYGVTSPTAEASTAPAVDDSNPFIRVDPDACIRCRRCVRACDLLNGVTAIGIFGRDTSAHIGFGHDGSMQDSACESCGMCEAVCPTDALTARPLARAPRGRPVVEMHPRDSQRRAIPDGGTVRVRSRRGAVTAVAHVSADITPGTVFMPFHFTEAAANVLTHAALDPIAKIPEYKVCAVAVEAASAPGTRRAREGRRG
jgi:predicted molibdopterin-dependent oxidoreductase YjgC